MCLFEKTSVYWKFHKIKGNWGTVKGWEAAWGRMGKDGLFLLRMKKRLQILHRDCNYVWTFPFLSSFLGNWKIVSKRLNCKTPRLRSFKIGILIP